MKATQVWNGTPITQLPTINTFSYDFYRTRVQSLFTLVSNSLTHWLTHSCLVNLIDVTLLCEDGNSKLVEVVTVVDVDDEKQFTP